MIASVKTVTKANGDTTLYSTTPGSPSTVYSIRIVAPGIVVRFNQDSPTEVFYPWHRINYLQGGKDEYGRELEQLDYLGLGGD